jgi:hypothetical protein
MKFRVFATRLQPAPPPSPMRLEITLVEERLGVQGTHEASAYSRSFGEVERVALALADSTLDARYKLAIMATCDRAMREWNLAKSSDTIVDIDRKQLQSLDFVPSSSPISGIQIR